MKRLFLIGVCVASGVFAGNEVSLTDLTGSTQTNRPVTISRVFVQGEIPNYPRPSISGAPLSQWQSNVMNRWTDGSVKHALITFNQSFTGNQTIAVSFIASVSPCHLGNQSTCDAAGPSQANILAFNGSGWGGSIETTQASAMQTTNARTMIGAGAWRFWVTGPLMSQVIVEDRSSALAYDYGYKDVRYTRVADGGSVTSGATSFSVLDAGDYSVGSIIQWDSEQMRVAAIAGNTVTVTRSWNATGATSHSWSSTIALAGQSAAWVGARNDRYKSLHPIFVLTQYPNWPGVKVEYILENCWTDRLQSEVYDLVLKSGSSLANTRYTKPAYAHPYATRWRKTFWDGTQPGAIKTDLNLAYLTSAKGIPNYDPARTVGASAISLEKAAWNASDKGDLGGSGLYLKGFEETGGRPEIGFFPRWAARWLFTMDPQLLDQTVASGEIGAYVARTHYRESTSTKWFDGGHTVNAFGRPFSVDARPGASSGNWAWADSVDGFSAIGRADDGGWSPDMAHMPSFAYLPYLITGDWYFLEEVEFWGSHAVGFGDPTDTQKWGRHHEWGFLNPSSTEIRGQAWGLRNVAHAAFIAPDSMPEAAYFLEKLNNNIAIREGNMNVTTGAFHDATPGSKWQWGKDLWYGTANPLHMLSKTYYDPDFNVDTTKSCYAHSAWMFNFNHIVWGEIEAMGFTQINKLRTTALINLMGQLQDAGYDPYLAGAYRMPIVNLYSGSCIATETIGPSGTIWFGPYFTNWADVYQAQLSSVRSTAVSDWNSRAADPEHGYPIIAYAAASYLPGLTGGGYSGTAAYAWITPKIDISYLGGSTANCTASGRDVSSCDNPKWSLVPRAASTSSPRRQISATVRAGSVH